MNKSLRHGLGGIAALAIGLAGWGSAATAQQCTTSLMQPPPGWVSLPSGGPLNGVLQPALTMKCEGCAPELAVGVGAGPPPAIMPRTLTGTAWAEAVATSTVGAQYLGALLDRVRAESPQCAVSGEIEGVTMVNPLSLFSVVARKRCQPEGTEISWFDFSGFDGKCLYVVSASWKGAAPPSQVRRQMHDLLQRIKFGP